mmetsp:Transcript_31693/g.67111  ORF Transcript_31693/g.67111 Transcript_31693/m.67111 type:complete len:304 (-) Transcript_31693:77-988(-)
MSPTRIQPAHDLRQKLPLPAPRTRVLVQHAIFPQRRFQRIVKLLPRHPPLAIERARRGNLRIRNSRKGRELMRAPRPSSFARERRDLILKQLSLIVHLVQHGVAPSHQGGRFVEHCFVLIVVGERIGGSANGSIAGGSVGGLVGEEDFGVAVDAADAVAAGGVVGGAGLGGLGRVEEDVSLSIRHVLNIPRNKSLIIIVTIIPFVGTLERHPIRPKERQIANPISNLFLPLGKGREGCGFVELAFSCCLCLCCLCCLSGWVDSDDSGQGFDGCADGRLCEFCSLGRIVGGNVVVIDANGGGRG